MTTINTTVTARMLASATILRALQAKAPLCVAYGMGVDSTAVLVGLWLLGIRPDLITFADTGSEKPETYEFQAIIDAWLLNVGFPPVTVVRRLATKRAPYATLEENCLVNGTLPSLAFGGRKGCSLKWKAEVQNKFRASWAPARAAWKRGEKVTVLIGYDAGDKDAKRSSIKEDKKYHYEYPLRMWGWDRDECESRIAKTNMTVPPKSACFFCPSTKPAELVALIEKHSDLADRIIAMEAGAEPRQAERRAAGQKAIEGLWGMGCKGTRGGEKRPGRMTDFIVAHRAGRSLPVLQSAQASDCGGCGL
jgi:hypothetical protein